MARVRVRVTEFSVILKSPLHSKINSEKNS